MATPYRIVKVRPDGTWSVYGHYTTKVIADHIADACRLVASEGTTYRVEPVEQLEPAVTR